MGISLKGTINLKNWAPINLNSICSVSQCISASTQQQQHVSTVAMKTDSSNDVNTNKTAVNSISGNSEIVASSSTNECENSETGKQEQQSERKQQQQQQHNEETTTMKEEKSSTSPSEQTKHDEDEAAKKEDEEDEKMKVVEASSGIEDSICSLSNENATMSSSSESSSLSSFYCSCDEDECKRTKSRGDGSLSVYDVLSHVVSFANLTIRVRKR